MTYYQAPKEASYDVVIVGGAMLGSSTAWWLSRNPDFDGRVLVVERDPSYEFASTSHTNSCIRQQFSNEINVRISQFGADFIKTFRDYMGAEAPQPVLQSFGYMYLADTEGFAESLKAAQRLQAALGAGTRFWQPEEIAQAYPFYNLDGILGANHNLIDEGYFDGATLFDWWKRKARQQGVEYIANEVVAMTKDATGRRVQSVTLASGAVVGCGQVVNASGPRAAQTAAMVGLEVPIAPRKRYTFIFDAERPLDRDLPLTIDPSGVHMRTDGRYYMAGCPPDEDPDVAPDDFAADHTIWEEKAWPAIANRIPQFEAIRLVQSWVGHYAYNRLDQNAVVGPAEGVENFMFLNGFSGHGFQQSPAMGRGMAELLTYGEYRTLDLSPFGYDRTLRGVPFAEQAVI